MLGEEGIPNSDRNSESPMSASRHTSRRTYRCSRSCFAAGAAARWARRTSDGGDDGGDARGSTTTMVDAQIPPMPNLRTTSSVALSSSSSALYPGDAAKVLPLPPIAQKSPYAYFFVGNDYYLKLRVMHFLFFTAWTANKKSHIMSYY